MARPLEGTGSLSFRPAVPAAALFGVLALVCAWNRSVWMDELHSLFHANGSDLSDLLTSVRRDNHPPLYFLIVRWCTGLFGSLRLPSIVFGIATVFIFTRVSERIGTTWSARIAPFLLASSSLLLTVSTEARMYSLLALAVIGLIHGILEALAGRDRGWSVFLWVFVGLHTHYFIVHYLFFVALSLAAVWIFHPGCRGAVRRISWAGLAAAVASLPWYVWGFRVQLLQQSNPPGASDPSVLNVLESLAHLIYYNISLGGPCLRVFWLASAGVALLLALLGGWNLLRGGARVRPLALLAITCGVCVPVWSALVAVLYPRAGFGWLYLAPSAAPLCLLIGAQPLRSRLSGALLVLITVSAFWLSAINAASPGTENYKGAVAYVIEQWRAVGRSGVIAIEPGPFFFPDSIGWKYYARASSAPALLETTPEYLLKNPEQVLGFERVIVLTRSLRVGFPTLEYLREVFRDEHVESFGYNVLVHVFSNRRER